MSKPPIYIDDKTIERFWKKVTKTDSCWLWIGANTKYGWGTMKINGVMYGAHRISYAIHKGEIPEGIFVCHNCPGGDNGLCVNPSHLWLGTQKDNVRDCVNKKRSRHFLVGNPTKYYGVIYDKSRKGWISYVYIDGKRLDIGRHTQEVDAARNHDRILFMKYHKKDTLNFPEEYNLSD